ncbi:MAG: metalloregulator ArsR/SmtB family transcription factor [Phycisphaerales bacterium]|nr:metalloregulator ArsR/SmtB family transcription factor [Phycisphaerales bacterium]
MSNSSPALLALFAVLGDLVRVRMLRLLEREELGVGEVAKCVQLPQATVSRHLKALHDAGFIRKRTEGPASRYRMQPDLLEPFARDAWALVRRALEGSANDADDQQRLAAVLRDRRSEAKSFFGRVGGEWSSLRNELFGDRFTTEGLHAFLPADWSIADLGCGTGELAAELAPLVKRVVAIDRESAMLEAARARLVEFPNATVRHGDFLTGEGCGRARSFDAATMSLVLHHLPDPTEALKAAARMLRKGGVLLVIDMVEHERTEYRTTMGHLHLGFSRKRMESLARGAKLSLRSYRALRAGVGAKGPGLFAALLSANG